MSDYLFTPIAHTYIIIHLGMNKTTVKSQSIGTFADFCKARDKKLLQESNEVAIDVPFYNEAIESILGELRFTAGNPIDWRTLVDYIKIKYQIIDREILGADDNLVIAHVRDLLFARYGDTILGGSEGCITYSTAEAGAKALVISQLASDILHKVRIDAGLEVPPEPEPDPKPLATVSLDYDDYDDDYYYGEKKVVDYNDFASLLKENVDRISFQHDERALDYCLTRLRKQAGILKYDDVLKVVEKEGSTLNEYLTDLAKKYLGTAKIEQLGRKKSNARRDEVILEEAKEFFYNQIAKEVIVLIKKETL